MTESAPNSRDRDYLDRLRDYYAGSRHIPSLQRICELMGFASKAAAKKLMHRLEAERFVERAVDDAAWIPARRFFERPLALQAVPAGMPVAAGEATGEPFLVDDYVVRNPSRTVMVPVKGDSMIDAGIHDGDIAVIERGRPAARGDLVVAIVDNEFTLKELALERGRFILKPRNPAYAVIRPKGQLEIFGVMVGLVRRYRH
ncbi:MAG: LexA family transcriptional regulator [Rhodocyclaceae bacterium]|nr:MAG: LexA family transcriptional regulator [Rhodocyclaceae bacterium]